MKIENSLKNWKKKRTGLGGRQSAFILFYLDYKLQFFFFMNLSVCSWLFDVFFGPCFIWKCCSKQTLAFLMSGVSMAGRISLLGWILQINIVEMFWINVSIIPYCPNSLSIWSIESHNNRVYFEKPMICHIILRGWLQTWRMFITST